MRDANRRDRMIGKWTLDLVEDKFELEPGSLASRHRGPTAFTLARQIAEYLLSTRLGLSHVETGRLLNQHDSTVAHNIRRVEAMREDPVINTRICRLEDSVDALIGAAR